MLGTCFTRNGSSMVIHVLKTWGKPGEPATTLCRKVGTQSIVDHRLFKGPLGKFRAVSPLDLTLGGTCKYCMRLAHAKKTDKQNMRVL